MTASRTRVPRPSRVLHRLPSFEWDPAAQAWRMREQAGVPMSMAASSVIDLLTEEEAPPSPVYQVGESICFRWADSLLEGTIGRIVVWGIHSYFTVKGEEEGAIRTRRREAIRRSYHQPTSVEYVTRTDEWPTCYVQETAIRGRSSAVLFSLAQDGVPDV